MVPKRSTLLTLVFTSLLNNQLDTVAVAGSVWRELRRRSPEVAARVVDAISDGAVDDCVVGGTLQEDKSYVSLGRRVPGDVKSLADRDDLVKARSVDGIAGW